MRRDRLFEIDFVAEEGDLLAGFIEGHITIASAARLQRRHHAVGHAADESAVLRCVVRRHGVSEEGAFAIPDVLRHLRDDGLFRGREIAEDEVRTWLLTVAGIRTLAAGGSLPATTCCRL